MENEQELQEQDVPSTQEDAKKEELNLVNEIRQSLVESGVNQEELGKFDNHILIKYVKELPPASQRAPINTFFNIALQGCAQADTRETRFCLVEDGTDEDWLKIMRGKVIPTLDTYQVSFDFQKTRVEYKDKVKQYEESLAKKTQEAQKFIDELDEKEKSDSTEE
jgi:hypothetical protein